jgi:hypothetical protein
MKSYLYAPLLLFFIVSSCNSEKTWKDDKISQKTRDQIHQLNNKIIEALQENNPDKIAALSSENLKNKFEYGFNEVVQMQSAAFSKDSFIILNEFLYKSKKEADSINLESGASDSHDYNLSFQPLSKQVYITVGYLKNDVIQTAIALIFGKYNRTWKLTTIQFGTLRIMNKDAIDWYLSSKANYNKGYFADAANEIILANQLLTPVNKLMQYKLDPLIRQYGEGLVNDINKRLNFPAEVTYVSSKPQVFRIFPQIILEGYFPSVYYKTNINIRDTVKLAKECDLIHKQIGTLLKGIDINNKMVIYRAFNSIPTQKDRSEGYGFLRIF